MAKPKLAIDPWARLESLVQETYKEQPPNSFTVKQVAAKKGWQHRKAWVWLEAQVAAGKLYSTNTHPRYYYFPE